MARQITRILPILALIVLLAGCHVGVDVDVQMTKDGAGTITVTVVVDKDIVDKAPGLAGDLRLDDVRAAGWSVAGPTPTPDGGLQVVLTQPFSTPAQATAILSGINGPSGPLNAIKLDRVRGKDSTTFTVNGTLQIVGGMDAFSDPDLLAVVGAAPYATQLAAANVAPTDAATITFTAHLPGTVQSTTALKDQGLSWVAPNDGTALDLSTSTIQKDPRNIWAGPASKAALIALVAWCVISAIFITYVVVARRRRAAIRVLR